MKDLKCIKLTEPLTIDQVEIICDRYRARSSRMNIGLNDPRYWKYSRLDKEIMLLYFRWANVYYNMVKKIHAAKYTEGGFVPNSHSGIIHGEYIINTKLKQ